MNILIDIYQLTKQLFACDCAMIQLSGDHSCPC